jgi:hypothetical protein
MLTAKQRLVGQKLGFLCSYIGAAARLLALVVPALPRVRDALRNELWFEAKSTDSHVRVIMHIKKSRLTGLKTKKLCDAFVNLTCRNYKVEAAIVEL